MKGISAEKLIRTYGRPFTLSTGEQGRAIVHPLHYKNRTVMAEPISPLGAVDQNDYLYIGPPSPDLTDTPADTILEMNGQKYVFYRGEMIYAADRPFYVWAILRKAVGV